MNLLKRSEGSLDEALLETLKAVLAGEPIPADIYMALTANGISPEKLERLILTLKI